MQDRFVKGYIAGAIGGITMSLLSLLLFSVGLITSRIIDRTGIIFLGYVPITLGEQLISLVIQIGHSALVGILFIYLVPIIGNKYLRFKAATLGAIIWFIVFSIGSLYKLPLFYNLPWFSVAGNLFTSSMWGVSNATVLIWLEKHGETTEKSRQSCQVMPSPAYKLYSDENVERLEKRLEQDEKLMMQVISEQRKSKRSLLPWFKFW